MLLRYHFRQLIYFSYATLTELGYGDITPTSGCAQICACLETMSGRMYPAVLVARLVGLHINQSGATT
ncbi:MAG TPA: potassium channel family protein [Isosphaeraceae bacterium]|nr:potassium channel family protein [Isosphaeraceae bacterium]